MLDTFNYKLALNALAADGETGGPCYQKRPSDGQWTIDALLTVRGSPPPLYAIRLTTIKHHLITEVLASHNALQAPRRAQVIHGVSTKVELQAALSASVVDATNMTSSQGQDPAGPAARPLTARFLLHNIGYADAVDVRVSMFASPRWPRSSSELVFNDTTDNGTLDTPAGDVADSNGVEDVQPIGASALRALQSGQRQLVNVSLNISTLPVGVYAISAVWSSSSDQYDTSRNFLVVGALQVRPPDACHGASTCRTCLTRLPSIDQGVPADEGGALVCGWCSETRSCMVGNSSSPLVPRSCSVAYWYPPSSTRAGADDDTSMTDLFAPCCGDGVWDGDEECDGSIDTVRGSCCEHTNCTLRSAASVCDRSDRPCALHSGRCDGSSYLCLVNPAVETLQPNGTTCRSAAGACDLVELCDGQSALCPPDAYADAGTTCRSAAGPCDLQEVGR